MENYRQNRQTLAGRFAALGPSRNPYKSNEQFNDDFKSEEGIDRLISNTKTYLGETYTKDQFIKKFACDKDGFKNSQYCLSSLQPNNEINPTFSCIKPYYDKLGKKLTTQKNGSVTVMPMSTYVRVFSKDNKYYEYTVNEKKITTTGRWECTGPSSFRIISDGNQEWLSSDSLGWTDIAPEANDNFPLKFGSKGPNVVKLQKFLNDKISGNPLTVNGVFDQKTQDKLIEFQKKEGIIE
jgi:hypothetical protein